MGASQSTSQPITKIITTLPVLYSTSDDYTVIKKSKPKKQIDVAPYPTNVNSPKSKKKTMPSLGIEKNAQITINNELLVAKFSIFQPQECIDFADKLKDMIMSTEVGKVISTGSIPVGHCRFLKIYVTNDNHFYLMPLTFSHSVNSIQWTEGSFTIDNILLPQLLSMIKRQKQLINVNGGFMFYLEFYIRRKIYSGSDVFHTDIDNSGRRFTPTYVSVTNISQTGYGLSTEIKSNNNDNRSYTFVTQRCETVILHNDLLKHRTPASNEINESRYNQQHSVIEHQTGLTDFNTPVINELNTNIREKRDPRHIIRMLIEEGQNDIDLTNSHDITHLVPELIFKSPIVNYKFVVDRRLDPNDVMHALTTLKPHSIGGKSKKKQKKQKIKRSKSYRKSYRKSYKQRGGNIADFAFYAENPETLNLMENTVEINLDI